MASFEKSIKICFATREYAHPLMGGTGGIGVFLKHYVMQLQNHANITIFSFGTDKRKFMDDEVSVVKIKDLTGLNEKIQSFYLKTKLPGYITLKLVLAWINRVYISISLSAFTLKNKFDIIEFHDYGGDAPYFLGKSVKVVRCHGSAVTLHEFMGYHNRKADTVFEKIFFKRINKNIIGVSNYAAFTTQKAFKLVKEPKVIYNGVELPCVINQSNYTRHPTVPYSIFYFGSIRERKGIDIACWVFNQIIEKFSDASFHVMGNNNNDYWNTNAIHILSQQALTNTTYYGIIPNNKINNYLQKAHVVIFPSYGENFSIALMEVMALGKVAVTSSIPAFKEIIDHGVNGFMEKHQEDYVNRVTSIFLDNELTEKVSREARKTIEQQYAWQNILPQNIKYYLSLLNE